MQAADTRTIEVGYGYPQTFHRLERRDATTLMDLLQTNLGPLKRYVGAVLRYSPDVDDVMQQVALKAYVHLDQFRFEANFGTWLRSIALNEIRQLQRERWRARAVEGMKLEEVADGRESVQTLCERKQTAQAVHRAIQRLPAKYSAVVMLRYLNDMNLTDIAERLSISVGAVKSRLRRARLHLARDLRQIGAEHYADHYGRGGG